MHPLTLSLLQQASDKLQQSDTGNATKLLQKVLQIDPNACPALQMLGLINASQGNFKEAIGQLKKAAKLNPQDPALMYNLAKALSESGNEIDAIHYHKKTLGLDPNNHGAWLNYSKSLANTGGFQLALEAIDRALTISANNAEAWNNKGAILKELNRLEDAIEAYKKALELKPTFAEAFYNLGIAHLELGNFEVAINSFNSALSLNPSYFKAFNNKGIALSGLKLYEESLESFRKCLSIEPNHIEALINTAVALTHLKKYQESLAFIESAISKQPNNVSALTNAGLTLFHLKQYDAALFYLDKAILIDPSNIEALCNKGMVLTDLKRFEEAISIYSSALQIAPNRDYLFGIYCATMMRICDWKHYREMIKRITEKTQANITPFDLLSLVDTETLHKQSAELWIKLKHPEKFESSPLIQINSDKKIRLGYFSADFRDHPVAHLIAELFETHDKDQFELYAFSLGIDDSSEIRNRIISAFDHFIDVQNIPDKEVALMARQMGINIAIDLTGLTAHSRPDIFAYRAAPIQINYLGYPGTTGASYIDYIIADKTIIPENAQSHYSEKVLYLPDCYQANDRKRFVSEKAISRSDFYLPDDAFVFCCFNSSYKINPEVFDCWMNILKQTDKSVLWLYEDNTVAPTNLRLEAEKSGVNPNRIIFAKPLPHAEHLARYRLADLFLDTLPYNAHTTASDALWAGLPVLTLIGNSFAGRVAASLLGALNMSELITHSRDQYIALAIDLATNKRRMAIIKERLLQNRDIAPLFNTQLFTKNFEKVLHSITESAK